MVIGKTNLKSVQEAQDEIRLNAGTKSWGAGSFAKGKKIMQPDVVNDVITVSTSVAASSSGVDPSSYLQQIAQLEAQIAVLEAEALVDAATIANLQSQVASLQSQVWSLQAQAVIDAATIVSLNAQIVSLQSQVANLSNRFPILFYTNIATIDDNFYVPPSYNDETVSVTNAWNLPTVPAYNNLTTIGGGYP
jgi:cell division protein FtsB